ncbi:hypothetical protein L915_20678 [Phytophthora nicotianae]|nr:hypothetical protein L915_20678 [Phytophthora nicotianae]
MVHVQALDAFPKMIGLCRCVKASCRSFVVGRAATAWPVAAALTQARLTCHVKFTSASMPLMRPCCFLLVVVFIIAACCHSISTAERAPQTKTQELTYNHDLTVAENVKLYLKDIKKAATEEERAFPGGTQLRGFFEKIGQGTNAKIAVDKVKQALHKDARHASVSVAISLLKMLIVVGVISVASGYIVYRVTNS